MTRELCRVTLVLQNDTITCCLPWGHHGMHYDRAGGGFHWIERITNDRHH